MEKHEVVPDVIPKAPADILELKYTAKAAVSLGAKLTPAETKKPPVEINWKAEENAFYTLVMTDPDAPSRVKPKMREWHHWLVGNIPGKAVDKGEVLSEYIGPAPPKGTGFHRYVYLVYKQPGKLTFDEPRLSNKSYDNRGRFSVKNFADKYKLGEPVAGNVFQAEQK